jgi:hypothetical protein
MLDKGLVAISFVFDAYGTLFAVHSVVDAAEKAFPGKGKIRGILDAILDL